MQRKYYSYEQCREQIGKEIRVTGNDVKRYTEYNLIGCSGVIKDYRYDCSIGCVTAFAVKIEGKYNLGSKVGLFWIAPYNLEEIKNTEDKIMNKNFKVYGKDAKVAILTKPGNSADGSVGALCCDVKPGDIVVCNYGYSNGELSVRKVKAVVDAEDNASVDCEVMGVCDVTAYLDVTTRRARRKELKAQMIAQAKRFQEEEYWRLLSEQDPAMKALYDEFKTLED